MTSNTKRQRKRMQHVLSFMFHDFMPISWFLWGLTREFLMLRVGDTADPLLCSVRSSWLCVCRWQTLISRAAHWHQLISQEHHGYETTKTYHTVHWIVGHLYSSCVSFGSIQSTGRESKTEKRNGRDNFDQSKNYSDLLKIFESSNGNTLN